MIKTLKYYSNDGTLTEFKNYTIENGVIKNKNTGKVIATRKRGKYNIATIPHEYGKRDIRVGRAIASTIHGPPPTPAYTADHVDRNPDNDTDDNIRWLDKSGQSDNRDHLDTYKSAFVVIKDGEEKTINEWMVHLKNRTNQLDREYTYGMITYYAQQKRHGFSYKEYPDLQGEVWKEIIGSNNANGRWEISNMNRVKYITKYAENVLFGERLFLISEYPVVGINGKHWYCHILSFMTFFPEKYAAKKKHEMILHENDDKKDFRPHKLRLGTQSENGKDAHGNGKHDGTKTTRMTCASYINGYLEKEHASQSEAVRYLKSNGYNKATPSSISMAMDRNKLAYGRGWKKIS